MHQRLVKIPSMNCEFSLHLVMRILGSIKGVRQVEPYLSTREVLIYWDLPATWTDLEKMLADIEYPPEVQDK